MYNFLSGTIAMASLVVAFFFMRFFVKIKDRFFLYFAIAFGLMTLERIVALLSGIKEESQSLIYVVRLASFIIILFAIYRKNRNAA